jgi:hypothetical protein
MEKQQNIIQIEGTEKVVLEKGGNTYEFTEGLSNGNPTLFVRLDEEKSQIYAINSEHIVFSSQMKKKIVGIGFYGCNPQKYKQVRMMYEKIEKQKKENEKMEKKRLYSPLYQDMEKISLPQNNQNPDDVKCQNILKTQLKGYGNDSESEGLNIAVASRNIEIRNQARKYCDHNFEIKYFESSTGDMRLELEREVFCKKCGFSRRDIIKEKVNRGWI